MVNPGVYGPDSANQDMQVKLLLIQIPKVSVHGKEFAASGSNWQPFSRLD